MGSVLRHICPVLAIAVAAGAMDIASAQQIGSASPDIRTGIYRGRSVTYEIIDGLAVWDGDIILGDSRGTRAQRRIRRARQGTRHPRESIAGGKQQEKTLARRYHSLRHRSRNFSSTRMFPMRSSIGTKTRSSAWWRERVSRTGFASCRPTAADVGLL